MRDRRLHVERTRFVLVESLSAGNVGACARALKNLGYARLDLVRPRCDPFDPEARKMAVGARDVLSAANVHASLDEALTGAQVVVGTTRRTGRQRRPHFRLDNLTAEMAGAAGHAELAVVFGREDHGLADAELDRCTHLVFLPSADEYPSYNLSQAVLLVAYELWLAGAETPGDVPLAPPAEHTVREAMYSHLEQSLLAIGFLHPHTSEAIMRRIRRMLGRADLTEHDVQTLRGVARQILWAARQAGLSAAVTPPDMPGDGSDEIP